MQLLCLFILNLLKMCLKTLFLGFLFCVYHSLERHQSISSLSSTLQHSWKCWLLFNFYSLLTVCPYTTHPSHAGTFQFNAEVCTNAQNFILAGKKKKKNTIMSSRSRQPYLCLASAAKFFPMRSYLSQFHMDICL